MDYSLVSPAVRGVREHWYGVPFITYQAKVLPLTTEAVFKRPWAVLAPYLATQIATSYSLNRHGITEEDWGQMQVAMGNEMAGSRALLLAPYKDDNGNYQVSNLEYGLPWEFWIEAGENLMHGDLASLRNNMGVAPLFAAMSAVYTGVLPTKDGGYIEIYNSMTEPEEKATALFEFLWDMSLPNTFGPRGPIANLLESDKSPFKPETTLGQDLSRFSAYTFKPITDVGLASAYRIVKGKLHQLGKEKYKRERASIKRSGMTNEVFVETDEYKDIQLTYALKQLEVYKEHLGPTVIGRDKDNKIITVADTLDAKQEELIEIYKNLKVE